MRRSLCLISTLATTTRATTNGTATTPSRGSRGGSDDRNRDDDWSQPGLGRATAMTMMRRTLGRGPGNDRQGSDEHGRDRRLTIHAGPSATATVGSAIATPRTRSRGTSACRADRSASSFATATANTPYAARSRARWRPSARFESSPVVISETTTIALPIHGPATCGISANKG